LQLENHWDNKTEQELTVKKPHLKINISNIKTNLPTYIKNKTQQLGGKS